MIRSLSIVIPLYNEAESAPHLISEIQSVLDTDYFKNIKCQVIIADDGSSDNSFEVLKKSVENDKRFLILQLRTNKGQTTAMQAGIDYATGEVIVTLDADLENDPKGIPDLLDKLAEGYDIVSGWRKDRWTGGALSFIKRKLPSMMANRFISSVSNVHINDTGCTLKAYRADVLKNMRMYGDMHRFLPAMASVYGVKVAEVKVNFRKRRFGSSKYGFSRTIRVFLDIIFLKFFVEFFTRPMQFFGLTGIITTMIGVVGLTYLAIIKFFLQVDIGSRPLLLISLMLPIAGFVMIITGVLGEVLTRIYFESTSRKTYYVRESFPSHSHESE